MWQYLLVASKEFIEANDHDGTEDSTQIFFYSVNIL